jgi:hypothetical protein
LSVSAHIGAAKKKLKLKTGRLDGSVGKQRRTANRGFAPSRFLSRT